MFKQMLRILTIFCLLFSTSIFAQTQLSQAKTVSLTIGGGVDLFAQRRQLNNASIPFVALGYNFTPKWGVEALYGVFTTRSQNISAGKPNVHGAIFLFDGIYHFPAYKAIEPYALFGAGMMNLSFNNTDANNQGNINGGLGVQFFTGQNINFRIEGRDIYTIVGGKNDVMLDAALSFLFNIC